MGADRQLPADVDGNARHDAARNGGVSVRLSHRRMGQSPLSARRRDRHRHRRRAHSSRLPRSAGAAASGCPNLHRLLQLFTSVRSADGARLCGADHPCCSAARPARAIGSLRSAGRPSPIISSASLIGTGPIRLGSRPLRPAVSRRDMAARAAHLGRSCWPGRSRGSTASLTARSNGCGGAWRGGSFSRCASNCGSRAVAAEANVRRLAERILVATIHRRACDNRWRSTGSGRSFHRAEYRRPACSGHRCSRRLPPRIACRGGGDERRCCGERDRTAVAVGAVPHAPAMDNATAGRNHQPDDFRAGLARRPRPRPSSPSDNRPAHGSLRYRASAATCSIPATYSIVPAFGGGIVEREPAGDALGRHEEAAVRIVLVERDLVRPGRLPPQGVGPNANAVPPGQRGGNPGQDMGEDALTRSSGRSSRYCPYAA